VQAVEANGVVVLLDVIARQLGLDIHGDIRQSFLVRVLLAGIVDHRLRDVRTCDNVITLIGVLERAAPDCRPFTHLRFSRHAATRAASSW